MLLKIIVPLALMLVVLFGRRIPWIGGKTDAALFLAGFSALILGGLYSPIDWLEAWFTGLDRIAWIIGLSVFGGIYAQAQNKIGAMGTVLNVLRARFGRSPKGLIAAIMITLAIAGALLGDAFAVVAVVGVLTVGAMAELGLSGELITGIIAIGSAMGSIMPPVTQAVFMSASMINIAPDWATQPAYITVGLGIVVCILLVNALLIKKDLRMPEELLMDQSVSQILRQEWKNLIPLLALTVCVICCTVLDGRADFLSKGLNLIRVADQPLLEWLAGIPVIKMFSNKILLSIIFATLVTFCFQAMRGKVGACVLDGVRSMKGTLAVQMGLAFMLGGFYSGGTIEAIQQLTHGLSSTALVIGGGAAELTVAMLTGSQAAAQSAVFSFLGPTLVEAGFHPVNVAIFGSHLAASGQSALPTNLLVVVVAGMVSSQLGEEVKTMKAMMYSCICAAWLVLAGCIMICLPGWPFGG